MVKFKRTLFILILCFLFYACVTNNHKNIIGVWKINGGLINKTMKMYEPAYKIVFDTNGSGSISSSFDSVSNFKWNMKRNTISISFSNNDSNDILKKSNYMIQENEEDDFYTFLLKDSLNLNMIFLSK